MSLAAVQVLPPPVMIDLSPEQRSLVGALKSRAVRVASSATITLPTDKLAEVRRDLKAMAAEALVLLDALPEPAEEPQP